ncbi:MAG: hypothetical protein MUC96_18720 [Myxococcaceae bacterium]|nr:hypothetical protein [Myxococcaceae bacterium]
MRLLPSLVLLLVACSGPAPVPDAGSTPELPVDAGGPFDAGLADAGCVEACATTALTLTLRGRSAPFTRAQHGLAPNDRFTVEAHFGGDPACPTMTSPTPERTVVIANLRHPMDGGAVTFADGLRVTLFDFSQVLTSAPLERATNARATPRFVSPGQLVSFELEAIFDGGTLTGTFAAPHCSSLDG